MKKIKNYNNIYMRNKGQFLFIKERFKINKRYFSPLPLLLTYVWSSKKVPFHEWLSINSFKYKFLNNQKNAEA